MQRTRARIGTWPEVEAEEFYIERERSEAALDELEQEILQKRPLSQKEQLERWLQEAVDSEDFEKPRSCATNSRSCGKVKAKHRVPPATKSYRINGPLP